VQIDIARYLQYGPGRMIIWSFRGVGKSYITGAFAAWLLYNNVDLSILMISASADKARDLSQFVLRLLEQVPFLQHLAPGPNQRASMEAFDVAGSRVKQSPSVRSKGITATITGGRADVIIADDVEVPENSMTQGMREKISEKVKELDNIIKPEDSSRIIYLGTPQLEDTLYLKLPERGYSVNVWPSQFPTPEQMHKYGDRLARSLQSALEANPKLAGKPVEPRRFGEMILLDKHMSQGNTGFQLQYMLDPTLADEDRHPLKLRDLIVMDINPDRAPEKVVWATGSELVVNDVPNVGLLGDKFHKPMSYDGQRDANGVVIWQPYQGSLLAIDPSGRGKDETGWSVTKMLNSQIFAMAAGGMGGGYDEATLMALANIAKRYQVNKIIVEANFGDGMWIKLFEPILRRIYPCSIEEVKASNKMHKEGRIIDVLEPVMNNHRLVVDKQLIMKDYSSVQQLPPEQRLKYQLFYQMSRITRDKGSLAHDDRLEALAWGVWYWVSQMSADADEQIETEQQRLLEEQMDWFLEHALGVGTPKPQTWIHL